MATDRQGPRRLAALAGVVIVALAAGLWLGGDRNRSELLKSEPREQSTASVDSEALVDLPVPATARATDLTIARTPASVEVQEAATGDPLDAAAPAPVEGPATVVIRVENDAGSPLAGVGVFLAQPGPWGTTKNGRTRVTGEHGECRFPDVPLGAFLVDVVASTVPALHMAPPRWKGKAERAGEVPVTLVCTTGCAIKGRVRRADGLPVAGVMVRLQCDEPGVASAFCEPDAEGRFRLENAFPGHWVVSIQVRNRRAQAGASLPLAVEVLARPGEVAYAELLCETQGAWIKGRVVDEVGGPVSGMLVRCGPPFMENGLATSSLRGEGRAFAITGADGRYKLGPLPPDPHAVAVGDRHGTSGVTGDSVLLDAWPEGHLATPGDGIVHVTTVQRTPDVIHWRVFPRLSDPSSEAPGLSVTDLQPKIGYCRLFLDDQGAWTFVSRRDRESELNLTVTAGSLDGSDPKWSFKLEPPVGNRIDLELPIPAPR